MSAPLASQVARLIPMLASNHDGEIIGAVRAIERKLKSEGQDWHWLADRIGSPTPFVEWIADSTPAPPRRTTPTARSWPHEKRRTQNQKWDALRRSVQTGWLELLHDQPWLTQPESRLVAEMRPRLHTGMMFCLDPHAKGMLSRIIAKATARGLHP